MNNSYPILKNYTQPNFGQMVWSMYATAHHEYTYTVAEI